MTGPSERAGASERVERLAGIVRRVRGRQWRIVPHPGPVLPDRRTTGKSGALRAAIFGVNDGLVSNVSLIFGVAGAGVEPEVIVLAGVAGLLAGAFSMAAGEYISVRVQREVFERLIHLEAHEIGSEPEAEREELRQLYLRKGLSEELAGRLAEEVMRDPQVALDTHAREELGLDPDEGLGSPLAAAGSSFAMFAVGAAIPLIPFVLGSGLRAVLTSGALSGGSLFAVGASMTLLTGRQILRSGARMLAVGAGAAAITYGVGKALDVGIGL